MKKKLTLMAILGILMFGIVNVVYTVYPMPYADIVVEMADKYGVDYLLVYAIIQTESRFREDALSPSGAKGLMQIMDITGKWGADEIGISDNLFDPRTNIEIGTWYIAKLINQYNDIDMALMAYNAGSGNVAKWLGDTRYSSDGKTVHTIPFKETDDYIDRVNFHRQMYEWLY